MNVKLNGRAFPVEEAARRLVGMGLRIGEFPEALQPPFEIEFPFAVGASDGDMDIEVRGSHAAISALQKKVN
ncbi:hypothetical protein M0R72_19885 [Candidatus Pacearchaeota archaeon]|jgi:hypothetical protein|nr:hypothetical protein [Candidatus Pacearchaeota archaeon]